MIRKIIEIDTVKCNGCGLCVDACQEGAINIIDGKAVLLREDYCDGFGNCLPACPMDAISFVEREALQFDEDAVHESLLQAQPSLEVSAPTDHDHVSNDNDSQHWPIQIKLIAPKAFFLDNSNLLISADCAAFTRSSFHSDFMRGKVTLIGCPKLDGVDYSEKLTEILTQNSINTITVIRMEVPCCGGIENAVKTAIENSGKKIPCQIITLSIKGQIR